MSIIEETLHRLEQVQNPGLSTPLPASAFGRPATRRSWLLPAGAVALSAAVLATGGILYWGAPGGAPDEGPLAARTAKPVAAQETGAGLQPVSLAPSAADARASQMPGAVPPADAVAAPSQPEAATVPTATPAPAADTSAKDVAQPEWLAAGKALWAAGKTDQALAEWDKGVASLSAQQRLIAVAAFYDRPTADKALQKLADLPGAFLTRGLFRGQDAFYAVVNSEPAQRKDDLAAVRQITGIKSAAITTVSRLNQSLNGDAPVVQAATVKPSSSGEKFVAATTAPAPSTGAPATTLTPAAGGDDFRFDGRAEPIRAAFRAGQWREVEERTRPLLLEAGSRWEAWWWMGRAVLGQGRAAEAENYLSRAAELNPGVAEIWISRGLAAQERGDHARAVVYLEQARTLTPLAPEVWFNLGYSRQALGNKSVAEEEWNRFLQLAGEAPRYASLRRYVEQRLGR